MNIEKNQAQFCKRGVMVISLLCGGLFFCSGCLKKTAKHSGQDAKPLIQLDESIQANQVDTGLIGVNSPYEAVYVLNDLTKKDTNGCTLGAFFSRNQQYVSNNAFSLKILADLSQNQVLNPIDNNVKDFVDQARKLSSEDLAGLLLYGVYQGDIEEDLIARISQLHSN